MPHCIQVWTGWSYICIIPKPGSADYHPLWESETLTGTPSRIRVRDEEKMEWSQCRLNYRKSARSQDDVTKGTTSEGVRQECMRQPGTGGLTEEHTVDVEVCHMLHVHTSTERLRCLWRVCGVTCRREMTALSNGTHQLSVSTCRYCVGNSEQTEHGGRDERCLGWAVWLWGEGAWMTVKGAVQRPG